MSTITLNGVDYAPVTDLHRDSETQIVVLQRGWVVVGNVEWTDDLITVTGAKIIRRWGTDKGLGELVEGPLTQTVLDPAGVVRAHELAVVLTIAANADAWKQHLS